MAAISNAVSHALTNPQNALDKFFTFGERYLLNPLGYVPGVSTLSATVRFGAGVAEAITGIARGILKYCQYTRSNQERDPTDKGGLQKSMTLEERNIAIVDAFQYVQHGLGNMGRSYIEAVPVIGNLACAAYDHYFGIRMNYPTEQVPEGIVPLMSTTGLVPFKA